MTISCSICQEDLDFCNQEISVLNCGHLYHRACLQQWLNVKLTCPECRSAVIRNNVVQKIFPAKKDDDNYDYRGSSEKTKKILKLYDDSTKQFRKMFTERIESVENDNFKLTVELQKALFDQIELDNINLKLKGDLAKSQKAKTVLRKQNVMLNSQNKQLKERAMETRGYHTMNIKKDSLSVISLTPSASQFKPASNNNKSAATSLLLVYLFNLDKF